MATHSQAGTIAGRRINTLVDLAVGAALIAAAIAGVRAARAANILFGVVYLVVFVFGLFATGTAANILALNGADNGLHLVIGLVLTAVGLGTDRSQA